MKVENDLGRDPVNRLVWRIALPSMLAQLVSVLYSIVDRIYIGNIPEIGSLALAGVGVCGPIVTLVSSTAFLISVGGMPMMNIRLGEGKVDQARQVLANCFLMLCVFSVAFMALLLPLQRPILLLFGASEVTLPYSEAYFSFYLLGTPFALLSTGLSQFIVCQGYAKTGMKAVLLGAVLNILLDPVFIFLLDMGVRGAAVATVLSQLASCLYVLLFLLRPSLQVHITFGGYRLRLMGRVLVMGFSPYLIVALDNLMIIAMNAILQRYGGPGQGDMLITCATIVQSFMLVLTMPMGGISGGTQGLIAYNYGAGSIERIRAAQKQIVKLCVGFAALMTLLAWLGGSAFVSLFTRDAAVMEQTCWAIRVCTLAIIPLGVQYTVVDGFTAMGLVHFAFFLSFCRKFIYFVALFMLPMWFDATSVFFAEPICDVIGPLVSFVLYRVNIGPVLQRRAAQVEQEKLFTAQKQPESTTV